MGYPTKIATCCHCGSKAALKLDRGRHELACASCGAPLRNLKMLPKATVERKLHPRQAVSHPRELRQFEESPKAVKAKRSKPRKVKKRKGWFKDIAEDLFDFVEDVFD